MKKLLSTLFLLLVITSTQAQTPKKLCGQEILIKAMETRYPGYKNAVSKAFDTAKKYSVSRSNSLYTIPVVIHVVWKDATENLDDSIILSQIEVLNEDYRRANPDAMNTRPVFDSVAGDALIQFHLKEIKRVQTTNTFTTGFTGLPDSLIKETSGGGDDAIDPERNLNIWIVNMQASLFGQLLGYAYPPAALANWPVGQDAPKLGYEGVVLDFRTIGRNNPNPLSIQGGGINEVVRGRTATHEIGHYLGLRHIWGDGGSIFGGGNDCMQSDGIDDTPFANAQSNFDCNFTSNTCTRVEAHYNTNVEDMVENYMDYSAETCMNLFTKGQVQLMRGVLENERSQLPLVNTGTATLQNKVSFSVSPNPTNGLVVLKFENTQDDFQIEVKNILGETVQSATSSNSFAKIDLSGMANGVYIIDASMQGNRITKKIVLSK